MKRSVVIVDGVRTPFGRMGGSLRNYYPSELSAIAIKGLVEKTGITKLAEIDAVYNGSAFPDAHTTNLARFSSLLAGLPYEVAAHYVEMQCGSGIDCINHAAWQILAGEADVIIAGGCESYSQRPVKFSTAIPPYKNIAPAPVPNELAPTPEQNIRMTEINDVMAIKWEISREECDAFAARSQQRAAAAMKAGYFKDEIIPVVTPATRKTPEVVFDTDEHPRPGTTLEGLAKLGVVHKDGVTTAGNASGMNDGAAFVLMMSEEKAKELGYKPLARWVCGGEAGCEPRVMGIAAAYAMVKAMKRAGLKPSDFSVLECNEAFAAQNLAVIKEIEEQTGETINQDNWNPNGGAIAFGHPNGASGPRICIFTMKELHRRNGKYGIFGSCCGGGLGVATIIERI